MIELWALKFNAGLGLGYVRLSVWTMEFLLEFLHMAVLNADLGQILPQQ